MEELLDTFNNIGEDKITEEDFKELLERVWNESGGDRTDHLLRIQCTLLMTLTKEIKQK